MTIRFKCPGCESVMKIQDELAGKSAKCPKCKAPFKIPKPQKEKQVTEDPAKGKEKKAKADQKAAKPEEAAAENQHPPVDFPLEITPKVSPADTNLFDAPEPSADTKAQDQAPKPSVAELMREHEATRKKKVSKDKPEKKSSQPASSSYVTSGSAAAAITRKYDQKRSGAPEEPTLTREERRALEEKEALKSFLIKAIPVAIGIMVFLYAGFSFLNAEDFPDLGYVSGKVTVNGAPAGGFTITFVPVKVDDPSVKDQRPSTAYINDDGSYTLIFDRKTGTQGALPGLHEVSVLSRDGVILPLSNSNDRQKKVNLGESHVFDFSL